MPVQRPTAKGHLPSFSGDFAAEMNSWRTANNRPSLTKYSSTDVDDEDDEDGKSWFSHVSVLLTHPLAVFNGPARVSARGKARTRRRNNFILFLLCATGIYLWMRWSGSSAPVQPSFTSTKPQAKQQRPPPPPRPKSRPSQHAYRTDGFLEVHPNGTHPIFDLVIKAQAAWERKHRKASAKLSEAIEEYMRRYKRAPPKGFDKWWAYVEENKVQLPDEYDVIYERLEPFWGVKPLDIRKIMADWEDHSDVPVMVFGKGGKGPIRILKNGMPEGEASTFAQALRDRLNLLLDVEDDLPEFRAIISPGDTPNLLGDFELLEEARRAARKGKFIDIEVPPSPKHGWLAACQPDAPAQRVKLDFYAPARDDLLRRKKKVFVHDHSTTMDPCVHPSLLFIGGQFLSHYEGPSPHRVLVPQFSSSITFLHYDLLPVPPPGWGEERRDTSWEDKFDERLHWRGLNTGMMCTPNTRYRQSQRFRLVDLAARVDGDVTVLRSPREGEELEQVGEGERWPRVRLNPAILDIAFAGDPVQCEQPACDELRRDFDWRRRMDTEESSRYKYVIDVDGNGWSSRFKRLMMSNSLIFKSSVYPEWFADRIQPWVHYIPIAYDYSDLYDTFMFFRGDITGAGSHDEMAKKIALAGAHWARTFWRDEDATAYMYRLMLEYARVISLDRDAMTMDVTEYGLSPPRI